MAKIIAKSSLNELKVLNKLVSETNIHPSLKNDNILEFLHVFEDEENVYILLEMSHNQTFNELMRRRKRLIDREVQCYLVQLINGINYLHSNRIIHRDLRLENLFLSNKMELKIGNFKLATKVEYDGERKKTICGCLNYIPPEMLLGEDGYSYEADVWSLGIILYTLFIGKTPFEAPERETTIMKIKTNDYSFPVNVEDKHVLMSM
eukprot:TRINITY_DN24502_c0_g1_i1.p1 TRINITY_DN24502_c0_g1~~TRINITY_DN24502_c0_g1_i1.p1  ORF type:complete len:206 (-),score=28.15 TRINITY_DN24502_c0_g1_i1:155-772(-)